MFITFKISLLYNDFYIKLFFLRKQVQSKKIWTRLLSLLTSTDTHINLKLIMIQCV